MSRSRSSWAGVIVGLLALLASGCLFVANVKSEPSGTRITETSLEKVTVGETTRDWLIAAFGSPTSSSSLPDGGEILRYEYSESKRSSICLFLFFAVHEDIRTKHSVACFELKDGVVQRFWFEK